MDTTEDNKFLAELESQIQPVVEPEWQDTYSDEDREEMNLIWQAILSSKGDIHVAAEKLSITENEIILKLVDDRDAADKLQRLYKLTSVIELRGTLHSVNNELNQNLDKMSAADLGRLYTNLNERFLDFIDKKKEGGGNITYNDNRFNDISDALANLPPQIRTRIIDITTKKREFIMSIDTTKEEKEIAEWIRKNTTEDERNALKARYTDSNNSKSLEAYRDNPVAYIKNHLRASITPDQDQVIKSVMNNKKTLVASAHGVGKTYLAAALTSFIFDTYEDSITLTTAPNWSQVRDLLWGEVAAQRRKAGLKFGKLGDFESGIPMSLRINEHWYAKGYNARTAEGFQGRHGYKMFIVFDEGAGVPIHLWEASNTMLQSEDCRMLVIGNPTTTSGPYYDAMQSSEWNVIHMSALTHPNIDAELQGRSENDTPFPAAVHLSWVKDMIDKHCDPVKPDDAVRDVSCFEFPKGSDTHYRPDDEFRIRCLGYPPSQAATSIWSVEWLVKAREREPVELLTGRVVLGVDVARFGDDKTVIIGKRGDSVIFSDSAMQLSTVGVTGRVIDAMRTVAQQQEIPISEVTVVVDDDGVGGGVTDLLLSQDVHTIPVNASTVAFYEDKYPNRRSELWFQGAEAGRLGLLDMTRMPQWDYTELRSDLLASMYSHDRKGRRVVEEKSKMRKRLKRSPDFADAFNLASVDLNVLDFAGSFRGDIDRESYAEHNSW